MNKLDASIALPEELRQRMELAGLLPLIRGIPLPTMEMLVSRYRRNKAAPGWIDMKFDPVDGRERDGSRDFYRKDRVYGWIQGRGLESLTAHLRWLETMPGFAVLDKEELAGIAESLYRKIMDVCLPPSGIKAYFVMDPAGNSMGRDFGKDQTTLAQLFVLRGLMAYAGYKAYEADLERIVPLLRNAVDASIRGECLDDQIEFGKNGGENFSETRKGYEGQMISIGACELLFAHTGAEEDFARGVDAIGSALSGYIHKDSLPELLMIDAFGGDGLPIRDRGHLTTNPGHTIEFVGLALQFFRHAAGGKGRLLAEWGETIETLCSLAIRYNEMGRAPHGGIVRSVDAQTGEILSGNCPWWSSFEAARTFAELYLVTRDEGKKRYCVEQIKSYLDCIERVYRKPSAIGIPVQTVSFSGEVVPIIPATPDIDAGYHTGMPLLDVYEIIGIVGTMLCGSAEATVPARLGVRLQGHIARTELADKEMDPLRVRCCWFASAGEQALLLSADILEFSPEWSERFYGEVETRYGIPKKNIFLLAIHTHTAPAAIDLGLLKSDGPFLESLGKSMHETIIAARENMEPVVGLSGASTLEGVGINRRFRDPETGIVSMRPNYGGENDKELAGLFLFDREGRLKDILVNLAIHPTTLSVALHEISADYPGRAAARIRGMFGQNVVVVPIQGACGDIRPMILNEEGTEFAEGSAADIDRMGLTIAERVSAIFCELKAGEKKWIDGRRLTVSTREVELPLASPPAYVELEKLAKRLEAEIGELKAATKKDVGFAGSHENPLMTAQTYLAWARDLLANAFDASRAFTGRRTARARFSLCSLGDSLLFFSLPGEAFCRIGKTLKRNSRPASVIVCGYSGGSVGYIPTRDAFAEGGYEVESAFKFYGFSAPLSVDTEDMIYQLFVSMREEVASCQH
ncbi:MAG: hypothetical protein WCX13_03400 [Candidatus Hydrogenedentales bacterium]